MTGSEALIHLRVPAAIKARWVRESRAAGMRLTDWIVQRVEAQPMDKITPISIPQGLGFADLRLARDPVAEDLIAEVRAEDAAGQACSHKPGRA